jgi:hypothetical protein
MAVKPWIVHLRLIGNVNAALVAHIEAARDARLGYDVVAFTAASQVREPFTRRARAVVLDSDFEASTCAKCLRVKVCLDLLLVHADQVIHSLARCRKGHQVVGIEM